MTGFPTIARYGFVSTANIRGKRRWRPAPSHACPSKGLTQESGTASAITHLVPVTSVCRPATSSARTRHSLTKGHHDLRTHGHEERVTRFILTGDICRESTQAMLLAVSQCRRDRACHPHQSPLSARYAARRGTHSAPSLPSFPRTDASQSDLDGHALGVQL